MSDAGGFVVPDDTGTQTDLNTLFGVNQAVGQAPVLLRRGRDMRRFGEPDVKSTSDQSTTLAGVLQGFYALSQDGLIDLQNRLLAGGFYTSTYYSAKGKRPQFGAYDDDTFAAFRKAATQAARSGRALPDLIDEAALAKAQSEGGTATPVQFTHPDDLRATFDSAGPKVIGRRPDPAVVDNAIAAYHEMEAAAANQSDAAGNVTAPPDVSSFVEQYLRRTYPADAYRNGYADAYNSFTDLLRSTANG
jgi:hypothetical protein